MASCLRNARGCAAAALLLVCSSGCTYRIRNAADWASELAVRPGSSLPADGVAQEQVVTLFDLSEQQVVRGQLFLAGKGYVRINGGGTIFAGANRSIDPFLEVTLVDGAASEAQACRKLITPENLKGQAVAITGNGYFAALPGALGRQLGLVRLDTVTGCRLVDRR
jgi:hypothetical protein